MIEMGSKPLRPFASSPRRESAVVACCPGLNFRGWFDFYRLALLSMLSRLDSTIEHRVPSDSENTKRPCRITIVLVCKHLKGAAYGITIVHVCLH
jgi:hypothetical protein